MDECEPLKLGNPTAVAFALITASQFHLPYYMVWPSRFDPIEPTLKPPGTKRLKVNCDILLSISAFKFNLRRYSKASHAEQAAECGSWEEAGAYTRSR